MASGETVDLVCIKKTQDILGKYVKKPVLSEKLLKKPPFRFLHDVVNVVIKDVPSLTNLYSKSELVSDNIKDRDGKMAFLQKLIDVIKIVTNENVTARPSKIVAGHEAEKTNEMLQLLGKIIDNKLDCTKAVEIVGKIDVSPTKSTNKVNNKEAPPKVAEKKAKVNEEKPQPKPRSLKKDNSKEGKEKLPSKITKSKETEKPVSKIPKIDKPDSDKIKKNEKKVSSSVGKVKPSPKPLKLSEDKLSASKESPEIEKNSSSKPTDKLDDPVKLAEQNRNQNPELSVSQTIFSDSKNKSSDNMKNNHVKSAEKRRKNSKNSDQLNLQNEPNNKLTENLTESRKSSAVSRKSSLDNSSLQFVPKDSSDSGLQMLKEINSPEKRVDLNSATSQPNNEEIIETGIIEKTAAPLKRESTFTREESTENSTRVLRPRTSLRPPSVRPASARPGAPRRRDKSNIEIILQPNDQQKIGAVEVKLETFNSQLEDDGENLVIIENTNIDLNEHQEHETLLNPNDDNDEQKGHLVQQILETQKELVQTTDSQDPKINADMLDTENGQKQQSSAKEIDLLRDIIQNLTRSVNPLGKLMDFIPEDIDSMQLELTMWHDNYIQAASELKKEKSLTESAIEPLKNQLTQINANIKEYRDMIDASHAKILKNSEKIQHLLTE